MKPEWGRHSPDTYVVLRQGADLFQFNKKIASLLKEKANDEQNTLFARQFSEGYLYGSYEDGVQSGGRIEYVKLFSIIGIFILLIACINYMNLATVLILSEGQRRCDEKGARTQKTVADHAVYR
jgi:putative ABC transport system permease protein